MQMIDIRQDTIAAISTPPGRGGIGIVRVSGPAALGIVGELLQLKRDLAHARAVYSRVPDPRQVAHSMDDCLVTAFHAPHSYTGDTLVEIAAHGSPVVLQAILNEALRLGARLAEPGEFTQRAFLSGRIDLTQAEAVQDLIASQTIDQARVAAQQLGGAISKRVGPAKDKLLEIIALLEAGMDFASGELDDVEVVPPSQVADSIWVVRGQLEALAASFRLGQMVRTGLRMALVGLPNAGKSSLFNRLLERERAIVTPVPGTTRDTVEEAMSLGGIPVHLIDTAGLRESDDAAERMGIERTREAMADADVVLVVHDATQVIEEEEVRVVAGLVGRPHLRVLNKVDLGEVVDFEGDWVRTSAVTGEGMEELRQAILFVINAKGALAESGALNNQRQKEAVVLAVEMLEKASAANAAGLPHELILLDLHAALKALDSLTGVTTTEDILGRIFSTFCIGK